MAEAQNQGITFYDDLEPETSIRIQDQAVVDWMTGLRFRQQTPRVVTGWQSRQFSQKKELQSDKTQKVAMSYPMISLTVGSITPDTTRRQSSRVMTHKAGRIYAGQDRKAIYSHPWPLPITIPYQIDIYTKTRQDLRMLETALMCRFSHSDMTYLKARFPGYGELLLRLKLDRVDDTSELETGEKDRELRKTISTTMDGWIFLTPIKQKTIQKAHVVLIDAGSKTKGNPDEGNLLEDDSFMNWYNDPSKYHFSSDFGAITSIDESPSHTPPNRILLWVSFDQTGLIDTGP